MVENKLPPELKFPTRDEIAICKVAKVLNYGVIVDFLEYPGIQGFVHVSNVANSWIKNIRNFAREGQIRVAKVLNVDREKRQVDLAFNKVSSGEERAALNIFKGSKRSHKFVEMIAKEMKLPNEKVWKEFAEPLVREFGSLQKAFEEAKIAGNDSLQIPEAYQKIVFDIIGQVAMPEKTVKQLFQIESLASNGVELIKQALIQAKSNVKKAEVDMAYFGAQKYLVKVSAVSFKLAEKGLDEIVQSVTANVKKMGGTLTLVKAVD